MTDPDLAAVSTAVNALLDALEAAGIAEANLTATIWSNALPTLDGSPRRTHIDSTLTVRRRPAGERITLTVVPGAPW